MLLYFATYKVCWSPKKRIVHTYYMMFVLSSMLYGPYNTNIYIKYNVDIPQSWKLFSIQLFLECNFQNMTVSRSCSLTYLFVEFCCCLFIWKISIFFLPALQFHPHPASFAKHWSYQRDFAKAGEGTYYTLLFVKSSY